MDTTAILVTLKENPYTIWVGDNLLANTNLLQQSVVGEKILIVTNETIAPLYLAPLQKALQKPCDVVLLPDGEAHKNFTQWSRILDTLASHHHHRDTTVIALGGGVIGDVAGFAAACYQRGVAFIQIPTTLLAQVDAAIGGKTAINHPQGKNLIGAFHQPRAVIVDIATLRTLPKREFHAGFAEMIKAAMIRDVAFFEWLENNLTALLQQKSHTLLSAIQRTIEIKRDIVVIDEKENTGARALLNLGHTFAHAIENTLGYGKWLHGEAVAVGLVLATQLSCRYFALPHHLLSRVENLLTHAGLPTQLPADISVDTLLSAMQMDKKIKNTTLCFVLMPTLGQATLIDDIAPRELRALLTSQK